MIIDMDHRWEKLARDLHGSFAARVRGVVSPEVVLLSAGDEAFGNLRPDESGGTRLEAGGLSATITPSTGGGYTVTTDGDETLTAEPTGSSTALRIESGDRTYEASISPLRNTATAHSPNGTRTAGISGNLTGRRYEATFDPKDPAAPLIAISLLQHLTNLRSRAYRT
jgi:hypothetical protein